MPKRFRSTRQVALYALILVMGYWIGVAAFPDAHTDRVEASENTMAPEMSLMKLGGGKVRLSQYRGQWVFLNFWATWCPPCLQEMPDMETFYKKFKEKNMVMLAVSQDKGNPANIASFIKEKGYTFDVFLDPQGSAASMFNVNSIPSTFIINPKGEVVSQANGAREWTDPVIINYFNDLMAENKKK